MIWIHVAVRLASAFAALAAFYVAWFVYEDEERRLQNKIETWWLQFDDIRSKVVSRQAAFVVVVAQRANGVLDRMFGEALLAKDPIAEAVCLTLGGYYLWPAVVNAIMLGVGANGLGYAAAGILIYTCAAAPLVSPRLRPLPRAVMWMFAAFVLVSPVLHIGTHLKDYSSFWDPRPQNLLVIVAVSAGIALTLFQVAVARYAMRSTIASRSEWPIVLGLVLASTPFGIALALFLVNLFRAIEVGNTSPGSVYVVTPSNILMIWACATIAMCLVSTALWGLLAAIASIMLLHRIVWPLASRLLLYALGRYRLVQNKVALNAVGATLAGIAITGAYSWQSIFKHFGVA